MKNNIHFTGFYIIIGILLCCVTGCNTKEKQFTDRVMYNLAGEVSSCKITNFPCTVKNGEVIKETDGTTSVCQFSKEGLLTQLSSDISLEYDKNGVFIPNERVDSLIRNEKGQLVELLCKEDEEGSSDVYFFKYNESGTLSFQGHLNNYSCWENSYTYNTEGQIIEELCADGYDGLRRESKYTYEYKKMDKYGNWIIRIARDVTNGQDFSEEREIAYYEE